MQFLQRERVLLYERPTCCVTTAPRCKYTMSQENRQRDCATTGTSGPDRARERGDSPLGRDRWDSRSGLVFPDPATGSR
jgi:hypothetical protein